MRIAYVTETFPPEINGVSLTVSRTIRYLRGQGHEVTLIRPRQPGERACDDEREWRTGGMPLPMYRDLRIGFAFADTLRRRFLRRGVDLVHVATPGPLGCAAVAAAVDAQLPVTTDFRTNFHQYSRFYGLGWMADAVAAYLRRMHNRADRTFVPTQAAVTSLSQAGFQRLEVIGRGVDTLLFDPMKRSEALREQWGASGLGPVLLMVGRLAAEKNVELALRAFDLVRTRSPRARMLVVGDGPQRAKLQARFPHAQFVGVQRDIALATHYASADLFLFPSLSDTFGNVTMEALASGVPVVAFDTAAAAEHVGDGVNGRLLAPSDERGFINATCELAWQPCRLPAMGAHARAHALTVQWDAVLARFERALCQVVAAHEAQSATAALAA